MSDSSFANWLRSLREQQGVPLRVVAAAADLDSTLLSKIEPENRSWAAGTGCATANFGFRVELGDRLPTDTQAEALAGCYKIPGDEMRRRVVAGRIMQRFGDDPVLHDAISIVREEAGGASEPLQPRRPVTYRAKRRPSR